jgi:hypothetical protein
VANSEDPSDTPLVRHVLYTNDVGRLLSGIVGTLMTLAPPERIRGALQRILDEWDQHVAQFEQLKHLTERAIAGRDKDRQ